MPGFLREGGVAAAIGALLGSNAPATRLQSQSLNLPINGLLPVAHTNDVYICATMDWWPKNKCDYGVCAWTEEPYGGQPSIPNQPLKPDLFKEAVKQLSPFVLRLGGSLQDNISYEPKQPCEPVHDDPNGRWGFAGGCLKQDRWREIAAMCKELGCKLVFGLNGLVGRTHVQGTQWTGQWDSSNARQLLQFTKDEGIDVMAWELGNELGGWNGIQAQLTPEEVAGDFKTLYSMVGEIWSDRSLDRPRVMGPDNTYDKEWYPAFLSAVGGSLDMVNIHLYALGAGRDPALRAKIMDPGHTKEAQEAADGLISAVKGSGRDMPMWMGESGGAYNSGQNGTTNRFIASFWSLSELGTFARAGFGAYCRQTFLGGNYGLVDKDTLRPNPDFFAYLLFKRLMGPAVLDVPPPGTPDVKAFAHCTRVHGQYTAGSAEAADVQPGAVTLMLLNFSPNTTYSVAPALQGAAGGGATRHEYVLTADGTLEMFGGAVPRLNGQPLVLSDKGEYPALTPKRVGADQPITLPPTSIGFFVMTDVAAAACPRLQG